MQKFRLSDSILWQQMISGFVDIDIGTPITYCHLAIQTLCTAYIRIVEIIQILLYYLLIQMFLAKARILLLHLGSYYTLYSVYWQYTNVVYNYNYN